MKHGPRTLLVGSLLAALAGCGGGGSQPAPSVRGGPQAAAAAPKSQATQNPPLPKGRQEPAFTWHRLGPFADPLAYDARDHAQGDHNGAGVFVYAEHQGTTYVLLARRASWLSGPGTWGTFGGQVDAADVDASGSRSYARAAEHEFYEETATVYHGTDANALRACPSHHHPWRGGGGFRTFFSRQAFVPETVLDAGHAYAEQHDLPHKFRENDRFLWIRLDELKAYARTAAPSFACTDVHGRRHDLPMFWGFLGALRDPGYRAVLDEL